MLTIILYSKKVFVITAYRFALKTDGCAIMVVISHNLRNQNLPSGYFEKVILYIFRFNHCCYHLGFSTHDLWPFIP